MVKNKKAEEADKLRDLGDEFSEKKISFSSVRMTTASKFAADFCAGVLDNQFNAIMNHAVAELADRTTFRGKHWRDYYHPHEGVAWCRLAVAGFPMPKDEARREFMLAHKPFFFAKQGKEWIADEQKIHVLWPLFDGLCDHWLKRRQIDAWATGEKMQEYLKDARVTAPAWGPKAEIER